MKKKVLKVRRYEIVTQSKYLTEEKIKSVLIEKAGVIVSFVYILHDKDMNEEGTPKEAHWHLLIKLNDSYEAKYVAAWFGLGENYLSKIKGDWADALKYLTHENAPEKYQYDESEVKSNYDWTAEKNRLVKKKSADSRREQIIHDIEEGKIREYNYTDFITAIENDLYSKSIEKAYKYRQDKLRGGHRKMECIYITGPSGTGKTTFAKEICEKKGYSYYVSSGSNDILDGYKGQDALIIDELRGSCMGLSDLLKLLDNNTSSTVKSRYRNKVLECKLIIITSIVSIEELFSSCFKEHKEPIVQLKRRCRMHIRFTYDFYYVSVYNSNLQDYGKEEKYVNHIKDLYRREVLEGELAKEFIDFYLPAGAVKVEELENEAELKPAMSYEELMDEYLSCVGLKKD